MYKFLSGHIFISFGCIPKNGMLDRMVTLEMLKCEKKSCVYLKEMQYKV